MSLITDATPAWTGPVLLANDEIWQARHGSIFICTSATPATDDGIELEQGEALFISAGINVHYRTNGLATAIIAREAV